MSICCALCAACLIDVVFDNELLRTMLFIRLMLYLRMNCCAQCCCFIDEGFFHRWRNRSAVLLSWRMFIAWCPPDPSGCVSATIECSFAMTQTNKPRIARRTRPIPLAAYGSANSRSAIWFSGKASNPQSEADCPSEVKTFSQAIWPLCIKRHRIEHAHRLDGPLALRPAATTTGCARALSICLAKLEQTLNRACYAWVHLQMVRPSLSTGFQGAIFIAILAPRPGAIECWLLLGDGPPRLVHVDGCSVIWRHQGAELFNRDSWQDYIAELIETVS